MNKVSLFIKMARKTTDRLPKILLNYKPKDMEVLDGGNRPMVYTLEVDAENTF
jgi:hypothetical protein